jgi:hypothetical protein
MQRTTTVATRHVVKEKFEMSSDPFTGAIALVPLLFAAAEAGRPRVLVGDWHPTGKKCSP